MTHVQKPGQFEQEKKKLGLHTCWLREGVHGLGLTEHQQTGLHEKIWRNKKKELNTLELLGTHCWVELGQAERAHILRANWRENERGES